MVLGEGGPSLWTPCCWGGTSKVRRDCRWRCQCQSPWGRFRLGSWLHFLMGRRGGGHRLAGWEKGLFFEVGGWRNARDDCWDEGRKEGDQCVWIELTNMLCTSYFTYTLPMIWQYWCLVFTLPQFFFCLNAFFCIFYLCVDDMLYDFKLVIQLNLPQPILFHTRIMIFSVVIWPQNNLQKKKQSRQQKVPKNGVWVKRG